MKPITLGTNFHAEYYITNGYGDICLKPSPQSYCVHCMEVEKVTWKNVDRQDWYIFWVTVVDFFLALNIGNRVYLTCLVVCFIFNHKPKYIPLLPNNRKKHHPDMIHSTNWCMHSFIASIVRYLWNGIPLTFIRITVKLQAFPLVGCRASGRNSSKHIHFYTKTRSKQSWKS